MHARRYSTPAATSPMTSVYPSATTKSPRAGGGGPRLGESEQQAALLKWSPSGDSRTSPARWGRGAPAEALHAALAVSDREHDPRREEVGGLAPAEPREARVDERVAGEALPDRSPGQIRAPAGRVADAEARQKVLEARSPARRGGRGGDASARQRYSA